MLISRGRPSSAPVSLRRVAAAVAVMASALALTGACTRPVARGVQRTPPAPVISASSLSFHYQASGGEDVINQTLTITNNSGWPVAPVLEFTPLDANGQPIEMVAVTTAYGSDHGQLVVGSSGYDVLAFGGAGASAVADVRVDVVSVSAAKHIPVTRGIATAFLDSAGESVDKFSAFTDVVLTNQNDVDATERIVYIVWNQPTDPRESQQALAVTPIGGLVTIPRHGTVTVHVDGYAATIVRQFGGTGTAVSVKVFPSQ